MLFYLPSYLFRYQIVSTSSIPLAQKECTATSLFPMSWTYSMYTQRISVLFFAVKQQSCLCYTFTLKLFN